MGDGGRIVGLGEVECGILVEEEAGEGDLEGRARRQGRRMRGGSMGGGRVATLPSYPIIAASGLGVLPVVLLTPRPMLVPHQIVVSGVVQGERDKFCDTRKFLCDAAMEI